MTVLVVYATIEGQTGIIARFVEKLISGTGAEAVLYDACDSVLPVSFDNVDKVILAAPVHERRHPRGFEVFVAASKGDLSKRPTMMLSVSIAAAFPDGLPEAREYLTEMEMRTDFSPDRECLVAGAIRSNEYGFFERQVIRHVVLRGRDLGINDGPHEFTDWASLERDVLEFLSSDASGAA